MLTLEEATPAAFEVWPENWPAVQAYIAMQTQWLVGMAGATGLNYASLEPVLRMTGVPRKQWPDVFEGVRIMEDAALEYWDKIRKKRNGNKRA